MQAVRGRASLVWGGLKLPLMRRHLSGDLTGVGICICFVFPGWIGQLVRVRLPSISVSTRESGSPSLSDPLYV